MKITTIIKSGIACLLLAGLFFVTSCKKEYKTNPTPYNELISFKVPYLDGKDTLIGVIEEDNIAIWWPTGAEYPIPSSVKPVIDISRNAQVSPASKEAVELTDGLTYTVTAQDGGKRVYTVKLTAELPPPLAFNIEPEEQVIVGSSIQLRLENTVGDEKIYLQDENNTEYELLLRDARVSKNTFCIVDRPDGSGIPAGAYYVKVKNKYHSMRSESKFITVLDKPALPYLLFNHTDTIRAKRGDILTFPIRHFSALTAPYMYSAIFKYLAPPSYTEKSLYLSYIGTNDTYTEFKVQVPNNVDIGIVTNPQMATDIDGETDDYFWTTAPYNPYPIKIVE